MNGLPLVLALTAVLLSTWAVAADEQPSNTSLGYGPWAQGVSRKEQKAADELFQAGNAFMEESVFVEAAKKYREALEHWKHPAIHYNLALALMNFNQPTETHAQLVAATHYGPDPLDSEKYQHALKYKNLLENQLTWVQITCDEPGATVTLDSRTLFVAPGRFEGLMHPGMHSLVAIKKGYVYVDSTSLVLNPGERVNLNLKLYTEEQLIVHRSRWSVWIPWGRAAGCCTCRPTRTTAASMRESCSAAAASRNRGSRTLEPGATPCRRLHTAHMRSEGPRWWAVRCFSTSTGPSPIASTRPRARRW
jgi:hypothetical protein